eukprot:TRINITY_DN9781_c0_g1_i1.p2 TRINITY_DN9781_c0_g1~~TRINITY_DN9781_c0_g1_i1.p2  ORF type:complete len:505 (-),score=101.70 TRINITY_DN9781_c0_g1_i1:123-1637(-)
MLAMKQVSVALVLALMVLQANAAFKLPGIFGSNMALQRNEPVSFWGWGDAGASLSVNFDGREYPATVDATLKWAVTLPAHPAGGSYTITVKQNAAIVATLTNVIFGDVYFCSGQSNMQFTVSEAVNSQQECANANNPNLRLLSAVLTASLTPEEDIAMMDNGWRVSAPATVCGPDWQYFSAVCYFYGRDLQNATGVPIGLIDSDWGGTRIEAWSSPAVLHQCGSRDIAPPVSSHSKTLQPVHLQAADPNVGAGPDPNTASVLWNAMVIPFLSVRLTGAIWYQGESNLGNPVPYECLFPAMIKDWRAAWKIPALPFYFVQVSSWYGAPEGSIPLLRFAQESALAVQNVAMATAMDLTDYDSPYNPIHPRNKQPLAQRLSWIALNQIYGNSSIVYLGPNYVGHTVTQNSNHVLLAVVQFNEVAEGLKWNVSLPTGGPSGFQAGFKTAKDEVWVDCVAQITGTNLVSIRCDGLASPATQLRYAWQNWPICSIYNSGNLPANEFFITL